MKKRGILIILIVVTVILTAGSIIFVYNYNKRFIKNIDVNIGDMDNEGMHKVSFTAKNANECSIDNQNWKVMTECSYLLNEGEYTATIKNKYESKKIKFKIKNNPVGSFTTNIDMLDTYYLAKGGSKEIKYSFDYPNEFNTSPTYIIEDESIIKMEENKIIGLENGETKLTIKLKDSNTKEFKILVTDLITKPTLNTSKSLLACDRCTVEEAHLLDKILESRVKEAGEGTRGGVLAAARFLTLEFPYALRYFNENGRLVDHGAKPHIDGEGRYYHKGLYLSRDKFEYLEKGASTKTGPNIWGCKIYDYFVSRYNQNGFTCSGFVSWAMLNGGFDVGDVGSGETAHKDDLSDLGPHKKITYDYMKNGNYKVGDFIARNGHAALIIGISDTTIYTAESLPPRLKVYIYERYSGIVNDPNLTYVIEMGDIYPNGEGIITDMWE